MGAKTETCFKCEKKIDLIEKFYSEGMCADCHWYFQDEKDMVRQYGESILKVDEDKGIKFNNVDELFELIDKVKKETGLNPIVVGDVDKLKGDD